MIAEKILDKKPVSLAEVKEMVKDRLKESETPTYEQDMTLKYVDKFVKLSRSKTEKMTAELQKIEGVDEWLATKIVDILPVERVVLELVIAKKYKLSEEAIASVLDIVKKHLK